MFGRSAKLKDLNRRLNTGGTFNTAQQDRINQLRQPGADITTEELAFLDGLASKELVTAERRRRHRDNIASKQVKAKSASQQPLSKEETELLDMLIKNENTQARNQAIRNTATQVAGLAALGGGASVGMMALADNLSPFSTNLSKEGADLAAQQFRIEEEMSKRAHQDTISQRTAIQEADLQQDLRAMEQKMTTESQLINTLKQAEAQGPNAFDIEAKVNQIAAEFMAQGLEPAQAISKAIDVTSMQARNQGYL